MSLKWIIGAGLAIAVMASGAWYVWFSGPAGVGEPVDDIIALAPDGEAPTNSSASSANGSPPAKEARRTERLVQDGWVINCTEAGQGAKSCSAILPVVEPKDKKTIFNWVIGRTANGTLTSVFLTPVGMRLQSGVDFKLGNAAPRHAPFVVCGPQRCEASAPMDEGMVKDARAAQAGNAVATMATADGRSVNITMPIKGIDKVLTILGR